MSASVTMRQYMYTINGFHYCFESREDFHMRFTENQSTNQYKNVCMLFIPLTVSAPTSFPSFRIYCWPYLNFKLRAVVRHTKGVITFMKKTQKNIVESYAFTLSEFKDASFEIKHLVPLGDTKFQNIDREIPNVFTQATFLHCSTSLQLCLTVLGIPLFA